MLAFNKLESLFSLLALIWIKRHLCKYLFCMTHLEVLALVFPLNTMISCPEVNLP